MKIGKATSEYEKWVLRYTRLIAADIERKHREMAEGLFPFLRATFYRWAQRWPVVCSDAASSPTLLCVGDLHVENFGTWRDMEGRLVWGVNDFDESCHLAYTNDLVRLGVSALLAVEAHALSLKLADLASAILAGYTDALKEGGRPFVLAENHAWLRPIAHSVLRDPACYWDKMRNLPEAPQPVPESAIAALEHALPERGIQYSLKARVAGLGSLGRPRYVALAAWEGGLVAREAKVLTPSGNAWACQEDTAAEVFYEAIVERAVRCRDPFIGLRGDWIVRRLAPDCSRIELESLPEERDEERLLHAMGWETANIHLGNRSAIPAVIEDLKRRGRGWLAPNIELAADAVRADWAQWKESGG